MKSIVMNQKDCFLCGREGELQEHHVFNGTSNRKVSDENGMIAMLCPVCHNELHNGKNGYKAKLRLKKEFQAIYEMEHTRDEFIELFGRSYLK